MGGLEISIVLKSTLEFSGRIDSEYYRKHFLALEAKVGGIASVKLGKNANFLIGPFGSEFTVDGYTDSKSFRYIRGKDVKPLIVMDNDNVFMPEEDYRRLEKYALRKDDVMVSVVGTLGNAALVTDKDIPAVFSCKSTVIRTTQLNPSFLTVYLNCKYGKNLLLRKERGAIQKGLNLDDLKDVLIYTPNQMFQNKIASVFQLALSAVEGSKQLRENAESVILEALGLADWSPPQPLTYTATSAEAFALGRLDAQYFMPAKAQVQEALRKLPGRSLGERFDSVRQMMDPKKDSAPPIVRNYDVTDALQPILDDEKEPVATEEIGSTKKVFKNGDVAISRLRAYLREIAVVRTVGKIPSVGSSEFIVLRPKSKADKAIAPETLLTFLRSAPVQTILKWCQDGSQHPRFSESDLLAIHLPDAVEAMSAEIAAIVQEGLEARRKARTLLDAAKRAVEIAIEDNEAAALAYLDKMGAA